MAAILGGEVLFPAGAINQMMEHLAGLICLSLPLLLLAVLAPGSIGGGDIKLLAAGGFYMGAVAVTEAFFAAMILAGTASTVLVLSGRREPRDTIPLGPCLCIGMAVVTFTKG